MPERTFPSARSDQDKAGSFTLLAFFVFVTQARIKFRGVLFIVVLSQVACTLIEESDKGDRAQERRKPRGTVASECEPQMNGDGSVWRIVCR